MFELKQTETFRKWRMKLKDERARTLIASRLDRLAFGHAGDAEPVGDGISELRIHYGPGYRRYGNTVLILLCGGDKGSQAKDIKTAKRLSGDWSE
ncbi:type II toxin-antitoxin system RelE/ParE family toxin [Mesorhizobium sp. B292B1B]|uniref:type II toxin-antitoxin system RelE/ParE family toxin n=1 Tax=unclassified Mesorhizobium TaxID=325217 RepID=UPI001129C165|nr:MULTISPECIES: type II toxin-antitoxin system RelE/ParE family toxin [unclassified Mesorhizobium]MCA0012601.1 type II toxin-antitoxin system RelE/ParE family toxin [Mesorhizobium sp. B294B1A1]MCA0037888.1 type II toxin-antitoxin system RelE/ParE family toxin [Mesorhizobium sp. B292B1B]TPM50973.1 type II toxin-antitoxin system RelE/ParE family toxin [Mesorhizobium sp. B2-3-2]